KQSWLSNDIYKQKLDAEAQATATNKVNARERNQQKRIGEGLENGSLTAGEAAKLENKEKKLNGEVRDMREDNGGKLTPAERAKLNRQQNRLSRDIYKQKHNAQGQEQANNNVKGKEGS